MSVVDAFLKLSDVKGESQDKDHKEEIEILSWEWGADSGREGRTSVQGPIRVENLKIVKRIDKASPVLLQMMIQHKDIPEAVLYLRRNAQTPIHFLEITLKQVRVVNVKFLGSEGGAPPAESVSLNFLEIDFAYFPTRPDGNRGAAVSATCATTK